MEQHTLIVDTNFVVSCGFHGVARKDAPVAVLGAIAVVDRLSDEIGTRQVVWCLDSKPYLRSELFPGYKSGRNKTTLTDEEQEQREELKYHLDKMPEYLAHLGYGTVLKERGFESDDMISAAVSATKGYATIYSRDHDLYQLLTDRVRIYDPVGRSYVTKSSFRNEWFKIHPREWAEVKAIAGCNSDSIPGVRGVGELTAAKYVAGDKITPKTQAAIREFRKTPDFARNCSLTTLPYPGVPAVELVPDRKPAPGAWRALCDNLERPNFGEAVRGNRG